MDDVQSQSHFQLPVLYTLEFLNNFQHDKWTDMHTVMTDYRKNPQNPVAVEALC